MHGLVEDLGLGTLDGRGISFVLVCHRLKLLLCWRERNDFRVDGAQLWASLDGCGSPIKMVAGHREVAPFTV